MFNPTDNKVLLIGSKPYINRPKTIGGATVLFEQFIDFIDRTNLTKFDVCICNAHNNVFKNLLFFAKTFFSKVFGVKTIFINTSQRGLKYIFPTLFFIAKITNKKLILRVYGSHAHDVIFESHLKWLLLFCLKYTDLIYLETHFLISKMCELNKNIKWFPNTRRKTLEYEKRTFSKNFIFIGDVKKSKGIHECLKVFKELIKLDPTIKFKFYGPLKESFDLVDLNFYGGILHPREVSSILKKCDVLVLPTYYDGEGYPGVIIEAYMSGRPVITTDWKSIPEIVDNYVTGILVNPKCIEELKEAILFFNEKNYSEFSENAFEKFSDFDTDTIHTRIIREIDLI